MNQFNENFPPDSNEVIHHLISFTHIVQTICDLDRATAEHMYGSLSPWWQNIREMLLYSPNIFKSLLAALLCRDLSVLYRQKEVTISFSITFSDENIPFSSKLTRFA